MANITACLRAAALAALFDAEAAATTCMGEEAWIPSEESRVLVVEIELRCTDCSDVIGDGVPLFSPLPAARLPSSLSLAMEAIEDSS